MRAAGTWLLDREHLVFGVLLGLLAANQWLALASRYEESRAYIEGGVLATPLLSLLVTLLSATYMTAITVILLRARRPAARYDSVVPNLLAVVAGFGVYCFGLLEPSDEALVGVRLPLVMLAGGAALVLWALCYLGRAFSVLPQARTVVSIGPYAYVRHPMYVGNILTIVGLGLLLGTPVAIALALFVSALQVGRAYYEDRLMAATFDEYGRYMEMVGAFVPRSKRKKRLAALVLCVALPLAAAMVEAQAQAKATPAKGQTRFAASCEAWHKKALAGRWFTKKEETEFQGIADRQEEMAAIPVCKAFFEVQGRCEEHYFGVLSSEGTPKKPTPEYLKATGELLKEMESTVACKSIVGFDVVCDALLTHSSGGRKLTPRNQSILQECADRSVAKRTGSLVRAGL